MNTTTYPIALEVTVKNNQTGNDVQGFKAIVDSNNPDKVYTIVGINYKVLQHNDLNAMVNIALTESGLNFETINTLMSDGGKN